MRLFFFHPLSSFYPMIRLALFPFQKKHFHKRPTSVADELKVITADRWWHVRCICIIYIVSFNGSLFPAVRCYPRSCSLPNTDFRQILKKFLVFLFFFYNFFYFCGYFVFFVFFFEFWGFLGFFGIFRIFFGFFGGAYEDFFEWTTPRRYPTALVRCVGFADFSLAKWK